MERMPLKCVYDALLGSIFGRHQIIMRIKAAAEAAAARHQLISDHNRLHRSRLSEPEGAVNTPTVLLASTEIL